MKKIVLIAAILVVASTASAEITGITTKFGGGCLATNTTGNCTIKVTASGTEFADTTGVQLYAGSSRSNLRRVSKRAKELSDTGRTTFRVPNNAGGCYQVRTAPNGNDVPDHKSRTLCE